MSDIHITQLDSFLALGQTERAKIRSKTFQGLADAMTNQWGCLDD